MKTFKDLKFKPHPAFKQVQIKKEQLIAAGIKEDSDIFSPGYAAQMKFPNGIIMSVLVGTLFYSNGTDTYEAWAMGMDPEPRGYLTEDEVTQYMKEAQEYKNG